MGQAIATGDFVAEEREVAIPKEAVREQDDGRTRHIDRGLLLRCRSDQGLGVGDHRGVIAEEHVFLGREVTKEGPRRVVGPLGDLLHRDVIEFFLPRQVDGSGHEIGTGALSLPLAPSRQARVAHRMPRSVI